jgi:aminoglycoside phosphotransferase (APT) family kinase protein
VETRRLLAEWLAKKLPRATDIAVSDLRVPNAGESNETLLFDATWNEGDVRHREGLVLRIDHQGVPLFMGSDLKLQWNVMQAVAASSSVPLPTLWWYEVDKSALGTEFYVMTQLCGKVPEQYTSELLQELASDERAALYRNGLDALAQIHAIDHARLGFLGKQARGDPGLDGYLGYVEDWYRWAAKGRAFPAIEAGLRWLWKRQPARAPISLIWGDSRPGNMMIRPEDQSVLAVLDWEMAAIATPEADLAWWLMFEWLFSNMGVPVPPGVPDRDQTLAMYEALASRSLVDMTYFDVLAWCRFAVVFINHVDANEGTEREALTKSYSAVVTDQLSQQIGFATGPS